MSLWWLQPGWTDACCAQCGSRIWPEGDPDWGLCWSCMSAQQPQPCEFCDDTGDVHRADGEWLGVCDCVAGDKLRSATPTGEGNHNGK